MGRVVNDRTSRVGEVLGVGIILPGRLIVQGLLLFAIAFPSWLKLSAQEYPYFVTYSQEMEEPGNLDLESFNVNGNPNGGNSFLGSNLEFEYGLKAWWTTELYLAGARGQGTRDRAQTDPRQQRQGMEHQRELHCREEPRR